MTESGKVVVVPVSEAYRENYDRVFRGGRVKAGTKFKLPERVIYGSDTEGGREESVFPAEEFTLGMYRYI